MCAQEVARNLNPRSEIQCAKCRKKHPLIDLMHEEPLPYPHNTVVEGLLICPKCGLRTHSYYMTEFLRFEQERLKKALLDYHAEKRTAVDINRAYRKYTRLQQTYQKQFVAVQEKYRKLLQAEGENESEAQ